MEIAKEFLNGVLKRRFEKRVTLTLNAEAVPRVAGMANMVDSGKQFGWLGKYLPAEIAGAHARHVFEPGQVLIASRVLEIYSLGAISDYFTAHVTGDWGDPCERTDANEAALIEGGAIVTGYLDVAGRWCEIFTKADRSQTLIGTND